MHCWVSSTLKSRSCLLGGVSELSKTRLPAPVCFGAHSVYAYSPQHERTLSRTFKVWVECSGGPTDHVPVPGGAARVHGWIASLWGQNKLRLSEMIKDHVIRLFCFQPIALQRAHLCDTFLDIHLEAFSLFTKHRSLLIAVRD